MNSWQVALSQRANLAIIVPISNLHLMEVNHEGTDAALLPELGTEGQAEYLGCDPEKLRANDTIALRPEALA